MSDRRKRRNRGGKLALCHCIMEKYDWGWKGDVIEGGGGRERRAPVGGREKTRKGMHK